MFCRFAQSFLATLDNSTFVVPSNDNGVAFAALDNRIFFITSNDNGIVFAALDNCTFFITSNDNGVVFAALDNCTFFITSDDNGVAFAALDNRIFFITSDDNGVILALGKFSTVFVLLLFLVTTKFHIERRINGSYRHVHTVMLDCVGMLHVCRRSIS
ncbi:hypothetical protein BX666DRAFT_1004984 [Dichotomocladium elegans]|nr:hypothetical protein BX666DRAFT_1004984 [Dichotomocladium elegans]